MTSCCENREGILARMWSIKDVFLQVIRVGYFIICFKPNILKNRSQFLSSLETDLETRVLFSHIIYLPLRYKFMLKSPRMQVSLLVVSSFAKCSLRVLMKLV